MKHLLEHTRMQVLQELDTLRGPHVDNPRLEYAYEDMLDSIDRVLDQIEREERNAPWGTGGDALSELQNEIRKVRERTDREREQRYGPKRNITDRPPNPSRPPNEPQVDLDSPFEKSGSGDFDHEHFDGEGGWGGASDPFDPEQQDRHHAWQDGPEESFEEMKENVENVTASDLDPQRLRELADIAEEAEEGNLDPRDMSDDDFGKLLSRLRPNLVDWATGKSGFEQKTDKVEIANTIREALHEAQRSSDGNIDMLRTFQEHVSDSLFDLARNREDGDYTPEYDEAKEHMNFQEAFEEIFDSSEEENVHPNDVRDPRKP